MATRKAVKRVRKAAPRTKLAKAKAETAKVIGEAKTKLVRSAKRKRAEAGSRRRLRPEDVFSVDIPIRLPASTLLFGVGGALSAKGGDGVGTIDSDMGDDGDSTDLGDLIAEPDKD